VTSGFLARHPVHCAVEGHDLLGFYALANEGGVFELEHMWVDPSSIGRGIGAALFRHAVDTVRALGGSMLRIASDPNATGFYLAMGARRMGDVPSKPEGRTLPMFELMIS
jgi:GNAT superfamily N-acetyltransferase